MWRVVRFEIAAQNPCSAVDITSRPLREQTVPTHAPVRGSTQICSKLCPIYFTPKMAVKEDVETSPPMDNPTAVYKVHNEQYVPR